ncbi:hypothetical protein PCANC_28842 [Puccinia coronata f. sp. avenae]|uniref:Uncharacterized protein n=1 Tax=Puccinia coronata f. sp. avenae TaxID=200324 RepID=A0A2N5S159_9BASI|nr:hypothetical protein PCANC_28842 [Puccinia coronata f. sp. avenae]
MSRTFISTQPHHSLFPRNLPLLGLLTQFFAFTAGKVGSDGRIQRPGRLATKFESVSDSLGGARPSLNWMAASNINLEAAIRARFSGGDFL